MTNKSKLKLLEQLLSESSLNEHDYVSALEIVIYNLKQKDIDEALICGNETLALIEQHEKK